MTDHSQPAGHGPSHRSVEIGVAVLTLLFAAITIYGAILAGIGWGVEGPKAGFFPFYVGISILLAGLVNLWSAVREDAAPLFAEWSQLRQVMSVIAPTAVYVSIIPWLGLYVSSVFLIALFMKWLGRYNWAITVGIAVGVPVLAYLMFEKWFLVPLPKGPMEDWLGL